MTRSTRRRLVSFVVGAMAISAACTHDDRPTAADFPVETELVYPGAIELGRALDDGESGTYIDGGSVDSYARLAVTYETAKVPRDQLFDWYETELVDRGWTIERRRGEVLTADRDPPGRLNHGLTVTAFEEHVTGFVVRVSIGVD